MLKCLIRWTMKEQIRQLKEEVAMAAMADLGLEDELAFEEYQMEQDRKKGEQEE